MEGKETRFGIGGSVLAAVTTSNGATGSYNSMHDSYTPLGGMVPLVNMLLGEVVFGGLGTGLYSMVLVALLGLFLDRADGRADAGVPREAAGRARDEARRALRAHRPARRARPRPRSRW